MGRREGDRGEGFLGGSNDEGEIKVGEGFGGRARERGQRDEGFGGRGRRSLPQCSLPHLEAIVLALQISLPIRLGLSSHEWARLRLELG